MIYDDSLDVETDEDVDLDFKSAAQDHAYENWRDLKAQDEYRAKQWAALGGDIEAAGYTFKLSKSVGVQIEANGEMAGLIYSPEDARRIALVLKMHTQLLDTLETAMKAVKSYAPNQPEVMKVYVETNRFIEMMRAKQTAGQPTK